MFSTNLALLTNIWFLDKTLAAIMLHAGGELDPENLKQNFYVVHCDLTTMLVLTSLTMGPLWPHRWTKLRIREKMAKLYDQTWTSQNEKLISGTKSGKCTLVFIPVFCWGSLPPPSAGLCTWMVYTFTINVWVNLFCHQERAGLECQS